MRTLFSASVGGTIARLVLVSVLMPSVVSGGESQSSKEQPSDAPSHTTRAQLASTTEPLGAPPGTWALDAFQTDLFTGASTAEIAIVTPPGAGGVGPKIVLGYHSSTVDERGARDQAQGTGLGWTLDVGGFVFRPQEHDDDDGRHLQAGARRREPRSRADRQRAEHLPHQGRDLREDPVRCGLGLLDPDDEGWHAAPVWLQHRQ